MFGGGKVWQIWRVVCGLPNFNQQLINGILMDEIYQFVKLYFALIR